MNPRRHRFEEPWWWTVTGDLVSAERKYLLSAVTAFLRPTRAGARHYRQVTQNARESGWRGLTSRCLSGTLRTRTQNIGGWLQKAAPDRRISRDGRGHRLSRSATGVPERERTERRLRAVWLSGADSASRPYQPVLAALLEAIHMGGWAGLSMLWVCVRHVAPARSLVAGAALGAADRGVLQDPRRSARPFARCSATPPTATAHATCATTSTRSPRPPPRRSSASYMNTPEARTCPAGE